MWSIYTYGGGDFHRLVFNAIATIFGNGDYGMAITIAALLGFIAVMIMAAFKKGEMNLQWLLAIIMIFQITLVPKTDLIIVDEIVPANSAVVSNIPLGVSAITSIFSHFSHWSTGVFETVFSLPNDIKYRNSGLLFANTLVEESTRFEFTTPQISENFSEFWKSCVYYDLLLGLYTWSDVVRANDLIAYFQLNTSQTRGFTYIDSLGGRSIVTCRDGINNQLNIDYQNEIANSINIHGARLASHEVNNNQAVAKYSASMPVAFQYMTGMARTNAQIVGQNAVANSLKRGLINFASEVDAPAAAQDFALARAEQERKTTFLSMGQVSKKMLPILQHIFESFIYSVSIFVMLMAMTPLAGKVLLGYVKALFWINLWPPLYAVLHFAVTYYSSLVAKTAVITDGGVFTTGLSIMTNTGLGNIMQDYSAIAGYLSLSIPIISWLIVSLSGAMMAGLAGRFIQGYEGPVSNAADQASSGNVGLGNTSYMNTSAFQHNSSPTIDSGMMHDRLGSGTMQDTSAAGRYLQQNVSNAATNVDLGQSVVNGSQQRLGSAVQKATQESTEMSQANMATLRDSDQLLDRIATSQGTQNSLKESESNSSTLMQREMDGAINKWAESNNVQLTDELKGAIYGAIEGQGGISLFGNGATIKGGVSAQGSTSESESSNYQQVNDFTSSNEFSTAVSNIAQASRDKSVSFGISSDESTVTSLDASMTEQKSSRAQQSEAISEVQSATEELQRSEQFASTFKQNGLDKLQDYAITNGKMSTGEFDQLLIKANQGGREGQEAMESLRTMAVEGVMSGGLDPKFSDAGNEMLSEGQDSINDTYTANNDNLSGVDTAWREQVTSGSSMSSVDVEQNVSDSVRSIENTMSDPGLLRTDSTTVKELESEQNRIQGEGESTKERVENMRVISDITPGAAGIVGNQVRDDDISDIKEATMKRLSDNLKDKDTE